MASGILLTIHEDGSVTRLEIPRKKGPELHTLQHCVGGYIERVKIRWEGRIRDAYVDEDGITNRKPYNRWATQLYTEHNKFNAGTQILGKLVIWLPDPRTKPAGALTGANHKDNRHAV